LHNFAAIILRGQGVWRAEISRGLGGRGSGDLSLGGTNLQGKGGVRRVKGGVVKRG